MLKTLHEGTAFENLEMMRADGWSDVYYLGDLRDVQRKLRLAQYPYHLQPSDLRETITSGCEIMFEEFTQREAPSWTGVHSERDVYFRTV